MNGKMKTMMIAALLVIVAGAAVIYSESDSEASVTTTGSFKVFYKNTGSSWSNTTVYAFDAYQAVESAKTALNYTVTVSDGNGAWQKTENYYSNPNVDYGKVSMINGNTNFTIFVYNNALSTWVVAQDPLGWYRPFTDYASTVTFENQAFAGTANVAISMDGSIPSTEGTIALTPISQTSDFRYAFTLKDNYGTVVVPENTTVTIEDWGEYVETTLTTDDLEDGITIYGYGSDAYLAFKDALATVNGENHAYVLKNPGEYQYYQYYSWMGAILGSGTVDLSGTEQGSNRYYSQYVYWIQEDSDTGTECLYTLGFYSKLSGAYNDVDSFDMTYSITEKYYYS